MKNENDITTEELKQDVEETGSDLKTVRESSGITLKDLFESTRIRISILEAIESEEFHLLPEPVYARIFIKTYAQAVGVDNEKMLSRYEKYLEQHKPPHEEEIKSKSYRPKSHRSLLGWILFVLFVTVFLIFFLYPKHEAENVKKEIADKRKTATIVKEVEIQAPVGEQAAEQKTEIEEVFSVSQDIANKQKDVTEAAYKLTIEATELVWLNIAVDHNPPKEILLRPGEKIYQEASKRFSIDIGNAGGVNVLFQGKSLGILGERGEVIHLTLPKDIEYGR